MARLGSTKAMDSGTKVSFIQKPKRLASVGGLNTNSMPASAGNDRRFMRPTSRLRSSSAISTLRVTGPDLVWNVTVPRAKANAVGEALAAGLGAARLAAG